MKHIIALLLTVVGVFALAACTLQETAASSTYLVIDINPSIEFIVDEDGDVVSYRLLNEDAEIVAAELDFIGLDSDEAIELFLEAALVAGYIDVDSEDNVILITTVSDDETTENERREQFTDVVEGYMFRNRIGGAVFDSGLTHDEFHELAESYDVSPGKLRLAMAAIADEEDLTLEEALEMPVRDLMPMIQAHHRERVEAFRGSIVQERKAMRDTMIEEAQERVQAHMENRSNIPAQAIRDRMDNMHQDRDTGLETARQHYENRVRDRKERLEP